MGGRHCISYKKVPHGLGTRVAALGAWVPDTVRGHGQGARSGGMVWRLGFPHGQGDTDSLVPPAWGHTSPKGDLRIWLSTGAQVFRAPFGGRPPPCVSLGFPHFAA